MLKDNMDREAFVHRNNRELCKHKTYVKGSHYYICEDCGSDFKTREELGL